MKKLNIMKKLLLFSFVLTLFACENKEEKEPKEEKQPIVNSISIFIKNHSNDIGKIVGKSGTLTNFKFLNGLSQVEKSLYLDANGKELDFDETFSVFGRKIKKGDKLNVIYSVHKNRDGFRELIYVDNDDNSNWISKPIKNTKYVRDIIEFDRYDFFEGVIDFYGTSKRNKSDISLTPYFPGTSENDLISIGNSILDKEQDFEIIFNFTKEIDQNYFYFYLLKSKNNQAKIIVSSTFEDLPYVFNSNQNQFNVIWDIWSNIKNSPKVTFQEAKDFILAKSSGSGQKLIKSDFRIYEKQQDIFVDLSVGKKDYIFYTTSEENPDLACLSYVSQDSLSIYDVKCDKKISIQKRWNENSKNKFFIDDPSKRTEWNVSYYGKKWLESKRYVYNPQDLNLFTSNSKGYFVFWVNLCQGTSEDTCTYVTYYLETRDYGVSWKPYYVP